MRLTRTVSHGVPAVVVAALCTGCASAHGTAHISTDESRPHISWELRAGGNEGERDFVCGSAQPTKACILPVAAGTRAVLAVAHLSVHAAAQPTNYLGFMRASFFRGASDRKSGEINTAIGPGGRAVGAMVLAAVVPTRGNYTLSIVMDALPQGAANAVNLSQEVPVVVK